MRLDTTAKGWNIQDALCFNPNYRTEWISNSVIPLPDLMKILCYSTKDVPIIQICSDAVKIEQVHQLFPLFLIPVQ